MTGSRVARPGLVFSRVHIPCRATFSPSPEGGAPGAGFCHLVDKKKLDSLIADLAFHISGLEDLSDRIKCLGFSSSFYGSESKQLRLLQHRSYATSYRSNTSSCASYRERPFRKRRPRSNTYIGTIINELDFIYYCVVKLDSCSRKSQVCPQ